jgi:hypothetical protein
MELLNHDDGTWSLRKVSELEQLMLSRILEAADPRDCDGAAQRLYPSPISPDASLGSRTVAAAEEDWREYIEPDLRLAFKNSLDVVEADIAGATATVEEGNTVFEINVPKSHADDWCSALNQARLVIHHRHDLPDEDGEMGDDPDPEKWMAMLQSEIYSILMDFLVTSVMWLK